jgi:hypothetical protein
MNAILILLAVSAILGLVLGFYFSWKAIAASALVLAFLSAAVLQNEGLGFLAGIGIIVICLTVNQMASDRDNAGDTRSSGRIKHRYLMTHDNPNDDPGESSQNDIAREYKR